MRTLACFSYRSPGFIPRPDGEQPAQSEENLCACALRGAGERCCSGVADPRHAARLGKPSPVAEHQELS